MSVCHLLFHLADVADATSGILPEILLWSIFYGSVKFRYSCRLLIVFVAAEEPASSFTPFYARCVDYFICMFMLRLRYEWGKGRALAHPR